MFKSHEETTAMAIAESAIGLILDVYHRGTYGQGRVFALVVVDILRRLGESSICNDTAAYSGPKDLLCTAQSLRESCGVPVRDGDAVRGMRS